MRVPRGKEDDLVTLARHATLACSFAKHPLAAVPVDSVTKSLRRDEGDLTVAAFIILEHRYAHEPAIGPLPAGEDRLKFPSGFDGLHTHR